MKFNAEESALNIKGHSVVAEGRDLIAKAERLREARVKALKDDLESQKKREAERTEKARTSFTLDLENLRKDIEKTVPVAYGNHAFTTQVRLGTPRDNGTVVVYLERRLT